VKTDENGHPTYRFFRLGNNVAIPGSEIRGMISSVYEAVTNSCFRIFDEKRYISWRMEPEEFVGNSDKGITGYKPGIVKEINGKLKVFKVMAYRLPLYDYLNITEKIKFEDYKSQFNYIRYGKRRLCNALKVNNKIAEAAKKNLKYLKDLMDKDKNSLIELLCGRKEIIFKEECVNYVKDQCIDWIAILGEGEKKGFIKFTGLNNANIEKINKDDLGFNRDWNIWDLNIFLISEPAKCRPSQNQKYPRPHLTFIKNKVEYSISKRCERIFEEPAATQSGYKIKPNVFQQYRAILNDYNEFSKKIEEDVRKNFCTIVIDKEINDGDLVYFHLDDSGEVDAIIPVCTSRIADTKYLAERLPYDYEVLRPCVRDCLYEGRQCKTCSLVGFPEKMWFRVHEEGLCPACSLFGTQIYKGRGRFGFAWADHCKYIEAPITLDRLESPRPTWVIPGKNDLFKLPGRKFYLHHAGWKRECSENRQKELENKRNKNNATFQVLKEGTFHFKVFFENLDRWELGLLIFCLELGDNAFAHKMGHGKALGFGSIKIEVEGIKTRKGSGQFEEKDFDFKKETVKQGFAKFREWFPDTWKRHLNNFFQILYCPADKSPIIRYPALREKDDPQGFPGYEELKERREFSEEQRNTIFASPWVKWHQLN
jgi:CRISPR-associated protein (TIGR03986 family)